MKAMLSQNGGADKYLPTLKAPYINLAIIRKGECCDKEQRDEFARRTLHGGVDEILEQKKPIKMEDILPPEPSDDDNMIGVRDDRIMHEGPDSFLVEDREQCSVTRETPNARPVRFVLVEGPPGIGKSTFAWELCRRWDEILKDYDAVYSAA